MNPVEIKKECLYCRRELSGRADKKYCDQHCKSAYQYQKSKENPQSFYVRVDNQLKKNRKVLKAYNKAGKTTIRASVIIKEGFNPSFFTHYWKSQKGDVYLFAYEYGFLKKSEKGVDKYILVTWQAYMANQMQI
jgi:hypothetical protein